MPYLASPPGPPPTVVTPFAEDVSHSNASPVTASEAAPYQPLKPGIGNLPTLETPEIAPEFSAAPLLKDDFVKQGGESRAELLGEATAAGYLRTAQPVTKTESLPAAIAPHPKTAIKFDPNSKISQPVLASSNVEVRKASAAPSFYSLSGLTQRPSARHEVDIMNGLSESIVADKLSDDLGSSSLTIDTRLMKLDLQSQRAEPSEPFILPIPDRDRRPTSEDTGPVFSFPQTVPDRKRPDEVPGGAPPPDGKKPRVIELTADRQEYDQNRRIFTAEGKVTMRFENGLLDADRLQVNLGNRIAVAEGNVALTRGGQVLRGQRMEYNFVQGVGTIQNARGEINIESSSTDFATAAPSDVGAATPLGRPVSDRITQAQPLQVQGAGGASVGIGVGRDVGRVPGAIPRGGQVRRLRFEAEQIDFTPEGWVARNIQITNDPFSPPQLLLKADQATLTRLSPLRDELRATRPRLIFDQRVTIPIPLSRTIIDRSERQPPLVQFGFDEEERGGLFIQRPSEVIATPQLRLTVTPQIYLQRMVFDSDSLVDPDNFGVIGRLTYTIGPRTTLRGFASLTSLDVKKFGDELRASIRASQFVGDHTLALEYSYRDRLFNGSLGFQTVQTSLGALLLSPRINLGNTGIVMTYQAGFQYINADTDRLDLLEPIRDNNRTDLGRFQASVALSRGFNLWQGKPLPATPEAGLKYSPVPIVPYISAGVSLTGVTGVYTNGDNQNNLIGSVGLYGQFGHFSRPFFDYTAFSLTYIQVVGRGQSPFLFDRVVDDQVLLGGITQQIYGPIRFTVQTAINLNTRSEISTDFILEYSRRAYGIILRYNPILEIGSLGLRISDFNWVGGTEPFAGSDVEPVETGIRRIRD
ncbi:DUF3769 domain-containing protein [Leptothermofonsia sp. ETS-13]|uniref:DUF3769 domain-containing protein n=1 Tax=Leptothermofonsia sp. ETS-13 TaxID=3035696 RepID=UPI003B9DE728